MTKRRHGLPETSMHARSICTFLPGYLARIFADFTCLPSTNGSPVQLTCRVWIQTKFRADNSSCKATCKQPPVTRACTCGMEAVPFMIGLPQWICRNQPLVLHEQMHLSAQIASWCAMCTYTGCFNNAHHQLSSTLTLPFSAQVGQGEWTDQTPENITPQQWSPTNLFNHHLVGDISPSAPPIHLSGDTGCVTAFQLGTVKSSKSKQMFVLCTARMMLANSQKLCKHLRKERLKMTWPESNVKP